MLLLDIKGLLETKEIKDITIGSIIDGNGVGLFSTAGLAPIMYFDNTTLEKEGLQVIVRNKSYEKAYEIIMKIYEILNNQVGFNPQQSPFYLGRDEKGNAEFSVNYIIYREN